MSWLDAKFSAGSAILMSIVCILWQLCLLCTLFIFSCYLSFWNILCSFINWILLNLICWFCTDDLPILLDLLLYRWSIFTNLFIWLHILKRWQELILRGCSTRRCWWPSSHRLWFHCCIFILQHRCLRLFTRARIIMYISYLCYTFRHAMVTSRALRMWTSLVQSFLICNWKVGLLFLGLL